MKIEGIQLDNSLYLKNNVTLTRYETNINRLISGKSEEKKIKILEGIQEHTNKILRTESNKYDNAELELDKNQNHLNVITNKNFTLKDKIEYLYKMYDNNKPLSKFDKTDRLIRSAVLQTNRPSADSTVPADIEIMKRLVIKTAKILEARQEVLQKEMKEFNRRINICRDAIYFCDRKIVYLQTQIRNRKSAVQAKLNNAGQKLAQQPPKGQKSPQKPAPEPKKNEGYFRIEKDEGLEINEDCYGLYYIERGRKVYGRVDENGYFVENGHVEDIW